MNEIHLGPILIEKRHEKGITQNQLAEYMGISKAAVSKWENNAAYPDILMLPRLAAFFDISIDELMGYKPQLNASEIRLWYGRLSEDFEKLSFDEAVANCLEMAKQYYACHPFLFQLGTLLINHVALAENPGKQTYVLEEAEKLFCRVTDGAKDPGLAKEALQMRAYCILLLGHPKKVLEILKEDILTAGPCEPLLASAYQMTGDIKEAGRVLQVGIYKGILALINLLSAYMDLSSDNAANFKEISQRIQMLADAFQIDVLHPGIMLTVYLNTAQGWLALGDRKNALDALGKYTQLATDDIFPLNLHGDDFFDQLDEWFDKTLAMGEYPPRKESFIRRSIVGAVADNPVFKPLEKDPRFQSMLDRLKCVQGGK